MTRLEKQLREWYDPATYRVIELKLKRHILSYLGAKTIVCSGQGRLRDTDYFLLAQLSPQHRGEPSTVLVCRAEKASKYQAAQK